jgi:hypothetical protein
MLAHHFRLAEAKARRHDLTRRLRGRRESRVVFAHIRGTYKRVVAFNSLGWPELSCRTLNGPYSGLHSVWIEPDLLRVRRTRS